MKKALLSLLLLSLTAPAVAIAGHQAVPQDLSGSWVLNEAMSENALDKMRELRSKGHTGNGGFGGPPSGTGRGRTGTDSWGGGGRGRGSHNREPEPRGPLAAIDEGVEAIEIDYAGDEVSIRYADDRLRILLADGRKDKRTGPMGAVATTAKWNKKGELVVQSKADSGKTVELYKLDSNANRLLVDLTVATRMGTITFYRTYDRAADAKEPGAE